MPAPAAHGDLRRQILDASVALIVEGGVGALSMREVARRAGVSHQAPYHYFPDRESILSAIALDGFSELRRKLLASRDGAKDPVDALRRCGTAYVAFALAHPGHFRVMFRPELVRVDAFPETQCEADDTFGVLVGNVRAVLAQGVLHGADEAALTSLAWSQAHGLASLLLDGPLAHKIPDALAQEAHVERVLALFARTLGGTERPARAKREGAAKKPKARAKAVRRDR